MQRTLIFVLYFLLAGTFVWAEWPGFGPGERLRPYQNIRRVGPLDTVITTEGGDVSFESPLGLKLARINGPNGIQVGSANFCRTPTSTSQCIVTANYGSAATFGSFEIFRNGVYRAAFGDVAATGTEIDYTTTLNFSSDTGLSFNDVVNANGIFTTYNKIAADASHSGFPFTTQHDSKTGQGADVGLTSLIASATAGRYELCGVIAVTTAAGTSSTVPTLNLTCTDPVDSVVKTIKITSAIQAVAANPGTGVAHSGCGICNAKAATAISYSTTDYASVAGGAMKFDIYVILKTL